MFGYTDFTSDYDPDYYGLINFGNSIFWAYLIILV